jgi:hypothetical protein
MRHQAHTGDPFSTRLKKKFGPSIIYRLRDPAIEVPAVRLLKMTPPGQYPPVGQYPLPETGNPHQPSPTLAIDSKR